jgi:hypothetical protein
MGRREAYTGIWWGNLRGRGQLRDPGVDGRIILRWIFRKWDVGVWTFYTIIVVGETCNLMPRMFPYSSRPSFW